MREKLFLVSSLSFCIMGMAACSTSSVQTSSEPAAQPPQTSTTLEKPAGAEYIEMEGYRFKLDPDVQADGVAHLDFYVHDAQDKHIKGVTGNFKITKPDGTKAELAIEEEKPHDHYHGMLKLDQPGEYLIVAQVSVGDKKLNPRFSFTRKL
jgi:hypothetical protein